MQKCYKMLQKCCKNVAKMLQNAVNVAKCCKCCKMLQKCCKNVEKYCYNFANYCCKMLQKEIANDLKICKMLQNVAKMLLHAARMRPVEKCCKNVTKCCKMFQLKTHILTPFRCEQCDYSCTRAGTLKRLKLTHWRKAFCMEAVQIFFWSPRWVEVPHAFTFRAETFCLQHSVTNIQILNIFEYFAIRIFVCIQNTCFFINASGKKAMQIFAFLDDFEASVCVKTCWFIA